MRESFGVLSLTVLPVFSVVLRILLNSISVQLVFPLYSKELTINNLLF